MQSLYIIVALFGGTMLAAMVALNSQLLLYVNPLQASWVAHGIGALTALVILGVLYLKRYQKSFSKPTSSAPWWSYTGGLAGAFVVVLAVITVNDDLGVMGTLVASIVGQVVFSIANDHFGWFGYAKRKLSVNRLKSIGPIFLGAVFIIYAKGTL